MVKARSSSDEKTPRPLGRPRDPGKVAAVLDASWRLFLAHGVAAVTVDTIAAEAGVSKGTVYAYFPDKRALFQEGVRRESVQIEAAQSRRPEVGEPPNLEDTLIAFGIGIMTFLMSAGAVDFYSSLAGELRRDPELARVFYDAGPGRTLINLTSILSGPLATPLEIADPLRAAEVLFGMWQGMSNFRLSLGIDPEELKAEIPVRVAAGVAMFLKAYTPDQSLNPQG